MYIVSDIAIDLLQKLFWIAKYLVYIEAKI